MIGTLKTNETQDPWRPRRAQLVFILGALTALMTFRQLLANRSFVGFALSCGLAFAAMFAYISGSPFVLQDIYGLSPQLFGVMFGLNALGLVIVGQINGRLVGRVPPMRLLAAGLMITATGGVALLLAVTGGVGLVGILLSLFVFVSSLGLILPNATALALSGHLRISGSASALLVVLQYSVGAAAAQLVGAFGTRTALPMAVVIAAPGVSALAVFVLFVHGGLYGGIDMAGGGSHDSAGVAGGPGDRKGRPNISDVGYDT